MKEKNLLQKLSDERIFKIQENVRTTLGVEGLKSSKLADELGKRVLLGEISAQKAIYILENKYKK